MPVLIACVLAALVFSLPACAEGEEVGGPHSTLAVVMDFDQRYSPASLFAMERELESIMRSCSLDLEFRVLDESTPKESFGNLVVARFRGRCRGEQEQERPRSTRALGLTHVSEGEILPFSEVDCDGVRELVQPRLERESHPRGEQLLGRALGRVLAHELYHILANTQHHGKAGIAKPVLTPRELVDGQLEFEPTQADSIRLRLQPHRASLTHSAAAGR